MVVAITDSRVVPVSEDLTTPETRLEVIRGLENAIRRDFPLKAGEVFELGEWAVLNASGELENATATPVPNSYLVFSDGGRFDVHATGKLTVFQNSALVVKTTNYDLAPTYVVGSPLTVKLVAGKSVLTLGNGTTDPVLARVVSEDGQTLEFSTVNS